MHAPKLPGTLSSHLEATYEEPVMGISASAGFAFDDLLAALRKYQLSSMGSPNGS